MNVMHDFSNYESENLCDPPIYILTKYLSYFVFFIGAPSDCYEIFTKKLGSKTGVYNITLWRSNVTISVYCDMDTVPPGWTVI
jgi:hypothetical protein